MTPAPADHRTYQLRPRRNRLRTLFAILVWSLFPLLFIAHYLWGWHAHRQLMAQLEEYRLAGEPVTLADLITPPIPDDQNAAIDLRAAAAIISLADWNLIGDLQLGLPLTDEERAVVRELLDHNRESLQLVDKAMEKKNVDWQIDFNVPEPGEVLLPHLNEQRRLVHLLQAAALEAQDRGEHAEAMKHLQQILFVSRAGRESPFLVSYLVFAGLTVTAAETSFLVVPDLSTDTTYFREFIDAFLDQPSQREALKYGLWTDRIYIWESSNAIREGRAADLNSGWLYNLGLRYAVSPWIFTNARLSVRHVTSLLRALETSTWSGFREQMDEMTEIDPESRWHGLASILEPSYNRAGNTHYRIVTDGRLAAVALAVRWYSLDHDGRLPQTLDDLVPTYLPHVPDDPFDPDGGKLRYLPDPHRPILYSVDEDGIDDGGDESPRRRWDHPEPPPRWFCRDAVVHLTRQPRPPRREDF